MRSPWGRGDVMDDALRIHFGWRLVEAGSREVHLTRLEFDLLAYIAQGGGYPPHWTTRCG
jgi:hypothetical protein